MTNQKTSIPFIATHPGILIKDELDMIPDMKQKDLAKLLGVHTSFLSEVINGKRPVTSKLALKLEKGLGINAEYWNNLQAQYNLDSIRIEDRDFESNAEEISAPCCEDAKGKVLSSEITDRIYQLLEKKNLKLEELKYPNSKEDNQIIISKLCEANKMIKDFEEVLGEQIIHITPIKKETIYKTSYWITQDSMFLNTRNFEKVHSSGKKSIRKTKTSICPISDFN